MKSLTNLLLSGILLFSLSSCSTYYINTLSSTNMAKDETTGDFEFENDSLKISYRFAGEDAPVKVKVYNKLSTPVFVDWTKSALVFDGQAKGFIPEEIKFKGDISTSAWRDGNWSSAESTIRGSVQNQKSTSFIPPASGMETTIKSFEEGTFGALPESVFNEVDFFSTLQGDLKVKVGRFDRSNSPMIFRTYLTLYTQDGQKNNTFSFDREFYVSKSVKTTGKPYTILEYNRDAGDVFYTSKLTGYGKTVMGVGVAAAVVGAAALAPTDETKSK
ncbi:MAG: hypothetical protein ACO1NU_14100 [Arcticibacter sp.]